MDALFAVYTRRSVRQYDSGGIGEEQVENLLRAGMAAPSAGNSRPWHFIVIDDAKNCRKYQIFILMRKWPLMRRWQ
jgi:Nitroreductase